ncbi:MAG TPA: PilZ domain-containing protein [Gaiellaceae bacterium]|nr:PilZ domain-containing protein [Gaiellaceae bacterium]
MHTIKPPKPNDPVRIVTPDNSRLLGHLSASKNGTLTVALELQRGPIRQPFHLAQGAEVTLEWVHDRRLAQVAVVVEQTHDQPQPAVELRMVGEPEPVERRLHGRIPVHVDVFAWTLAQATRRLPGTTLNLSGAGALLRIPELAPMAATVELTIELPEKPIHASARVAWREPGLVGVEFTRISAEAQASLVDFLRAQQNLTVPTKTSNRRFTVPRYTWKRRGVLAD